VTSEPNPTPSATQSQWLWAIGYADGASGSEACLLPNWSAAQQQAYSEGYAAGKRIAQSAQE
jgi:hypothetical protein